MTLHCNTKTKNINLFLSKVQLLPEADKDSYTGEICNIRKCSRNLWNSLTATYSGRLGDRYTGLGAQTLASKKSFSSFLFQLYFNKKQVEVAINDFTMRLIISKWLRIQRCRQKRKTMRQRGRNERRNCQRKCFDSFNLRNRSRECSLFLLRKEFTLLRVFLLYYLLHLLRFWQNFENFSTRRQPWCHHLLAPQLSQSLVSYCCTEFRRRFSFRRYFY